VKGTYSPWNTRGERALLISSDVGPQRSYDQGRSRPRIPQRTPQSPTEQATAHITTATTTTNVKTDGSDRGIPHRAGDMDHDVTVASRNGADGRTGQNPVALNQGLSIHRPTTPTGGVARNRSGDPPSGWSGLEADDPTDRSRRRPNCLFAAFPTRLRGLHQAQVFISSKRAPLLSTATSLAV
jgi:hypothetical protein